TLVGPLLVAVIAIAVALVAEVLIPSGSAGNIGGLAVAGGAVGILMGWLMGAGPRWRTTVYQRTKRALRGGGGITHPHRRDIPLARINDVSFSKGLLDRLLGSGRLTVESAGEHGQIVLNDIPHVEATQGTLYRLVEEEQNRLEQDQRNHP